MTEKSARKLGEVLAFANVAKDTLQRGGVALAQALGNEETASLRATNDEQAEAILALAGALGVAEAVTKKAAATAEKLKAMRDLYVKDEWDNPAELLEWSGFFEGAAAVHWSLVQGVAEKLGYTALIELAEEGYAFHEGNLEQVSAALRAIGQSYE